MAPLEAPQLCFLNEAANLLASESPSTAAHLLSVHTQILHHELRPLNTRQQKHHCGGCGSIRQSNWSRVTQIKPKANSRAKSKLDTTSGGATVVKCLRCNQRTVNPRKRTAPKPGPKASSRVSTATASAIYSTAKSTPPAASTPQASPSENAESALSKTVDNASSKKRAKARKQGGLQALLASKKSAQPSLDLFDFLQ